MTKKTRIHLHDVNMEPDAPQLFDEFAINQFLESILIERHTNKSLLNEYERFIEEQTKFRYYTKEYLKNIIDEPILVVFIAWIKENFRNESLIANAKAIFQCNLISFTSDNNSFLKKIQDLSTESIISDLEKIREATELSLEERENFVKTAIDFFHWLGREIFRPDLRIEDPDRARVKGRMIDYEAYLRLIAKLDDRTRLVVKLLYFGGSRILEEVINLEIRDVNFKSRTIKFDMLSINYPNHVFQDIKNLIQGRKTGRIFVGRQDSPMNPATIFRKLKQAGANSGFGENLSPKALTQSLQKT